MKRNFKKIALAASFAAFGCNSFVNASLNGNLLKLGAILVSGKVAWDTFGLGDCLELQLLLKDRRYAGNEANLVPSVFKDENGEDVKVSDKLQVLVKDVQGKWIGDSNIDVKNLTLWQLVKDAAKKESRVKYTGKALKAIMSEVYKAMGNHKIINFEFNKNLKITKTLPEVTIEE